MSLFNKGSLDVNELTERCLELVFPQQNETQLSHVFIRFALWIGVVLYTINLFGGIRFGMGNMLHLVNLPFHEAGHVIFGLLGNPFLGSLGGPLGQLIMPLVCAVVLLVQQRDAFGASLSMWWFAENFIDLAPYIKDASTGELPLLGGNIGKHSPYGFHDFEYLLTETGLIEYDQTIAALSYGYGCLLMLLFLGWGAFILWRQYQSCQYEHL